jgi:transcriptional regulator with XRE-family HTH domain
VTRVRYDEDIDKRVGSVIRMRRVKLGMSQGGLGKAIGVSFQQIQKYEKGLNALTATRIPDFCRTLGISPNDLFGVIATVHKDAFQLETWGMKTAIELQRLKPAGREAITAMLVALPKRHATQRNGRKHS